MAKYDNDTCSSWLENSASKEELTLIFVRDVDCFIQQKLQG